MLAAARRLIERTGGSGDPAAIAARLVAAVDQARARYPELGAHDERFADALAARLEGERELDEALARLALPDVYLVVACLHGDRAALAAFERLVRGETERAIARLSFAPPAEDVVQEMLVKLVIAHGDAEPKLAAFGGHGALHAWLRVAATRTAISMTRRKAEVAADDEALAAIADDSDDQALAFLKSAYREEFKRAFAAALAELPRRARTLLRLQIIDQLTLEEIAGFYQVSRATAARHLADARAQLVTGTQQRLTQTLAIEPRELSELMRLVASTLYSTLPRLLGKTETAT
ncbi:MAG TPA: sigma-70 family RNA polymerase sigma factor [Kofleriaceae bacterium]|nr:sigma-70 family RNA polymerase sigma factor [Kofleriaceae bacterium]